MVLTASIVLSTRLSIQKNIHKTKAHDTTECCVLLSLVGLFKSIAASSSSSSGHRASSASSDASRAKKEKTCHRCGAPGWNSDHVWNSVIRAQDPTNATTLLTPSWVCYAPHFFR